MKYVELGNMSRSNKILDKNRTFSCPIPVRTEEKYED
jgi:hypothetical protein